MSCPFTEEELFTAYRVAFSVADARRMARETLAGAARADADRADGTMASSEALPGDTELWGITLSPDLLIMLSIQSDDLNQRVLSLLGDALRNEHFRRLWNERREELLTDAGEEK